jgi:hypothetical protein
MAIHGQRLKGSTNNIAYAQNSPVFLQVNGVSGAIRESVANGLYPYTAWTQFTQEATLQQFQTNDNFGSGWEIEGVAGETIGGGEVVYRSSNTRWKKAIADGATLAEGINMIGLCIQGGSNNGTIKILLQGFASISSNNFNQQTANANRVNGLPVYLDATTYGYMTDVAPSGSGEVVRTMGYLWSNPYSTSRPASGSPVFYFNPDRTWIVV